MIIIRIKGGLGNQLFQYVLGKYIEQKIGVNVKYDISWFKLTHRNVTPRKLKLGLILKNFDSKIASRKEIAKVKSFYYLNRLFPRSEFVDYVLLILNKHLNKKYYLEQRSSYKFEELLDYKYLDGYWQTNFFVTYMKDLLFDDLDTIFIKKLYSIHSDRIDITSVDVAIHVRRGDYVTNVGANSHHGVCSFQYYKNGIDYFSDFNKNSKFYFFSDDIEWVKSVFGISKNFIYINFEEPFPDLAEFFLMAQFKNFVIANSTFSWWAAIISNSKSVVAPKNWFISANNHLALKDWKIL